MCTLLEKQMTLPIHSIVQDDALSLDKLKFCYEVTRRALLDLRNFSYSSFDAQTTSNCCHGMSLLVRELILKLRKEDLETILKELSRKIDFNEFEPDYHLPKVLIELSQLYILTFIRRICPEKGVRTYANNLKSIVPLGTAFFEGLIRNLQRQFSNQVAYSYQNYLNDTQGVETCGTSVNLWGKYVSPSFIRKSSHNLHFAPSLYSMQVTLGFLIANKAKIVILNDIYNSKNELNNRYVKIMVGNGIDGFNPITDEELNPDEPVLVFGGCAYHEDAEAIKAQMKKWENQFPNLVLACDIFYPQFPKSCDDPEYGNLPFEPKEEILQEILQEHGKIKGVSASNPHLYCLNHIYPSSLKQALSGEFLSLRIPKALLKYSAEISK